MNNNFDKYDILILNMLIKNKCSRKYNKHTEHLTKIKKKKQQFKQLRYQKAKRISKLRQKRLSSNDDYEPSRNFDTEIFIDPLFDYGYYYEQCYYDQEYERSLIDDYKVLQNFGLNNDQVDNVDNVNDIDESFNKCKKSYYYLPLSNKQNRLLYFGYKCKRILNTKNININKIIKFFCENIPLNFFIKTKGEAICSIFSQLFKNNITVMLLATDDNEEKKFLSFMKKIFTDNFQISDKHIFPTLEIQSIRLNFYITTYHYHFHEELFIENMLSFGSFAHELDHSKTCTFELLHPESFNHQDAISDKKIISKIKNNLKNKILTLNKISSENYKFHKMSALIECEEKIRMGYTIEDPQNIFTGLDNMLVNTYTKKDIFKIINNFVVSSDTIIIITEYMNNIIDDDLICNKCNTPLNNNDKNFIDEEKTRMYPYFKPLISESISNGVIKRYCYHGFDNIHPSIIVSTDESYKLKSYKLKSIIVHGLCFLKTMEEYNHDQCNGICVSCGMVFI